jgi:O-antigen/teichoic acid export membrane protein
LENPSESPRAKLVKGTAYSFLATVLVKLAFIVNSIVVARLLDASQLGILAILGGVISDTGQFAALGIGGAAVKYIAEYEAKGRPSHSMARRRIAANSNR